MSGTGRSALRNTDVLVAGSGVAGLATALFLAEQGVDCYLLGGLRERLRPPRILGVHPRAMELLRSLGVEEAVRDLPSARALARNSGIISMESLTGPELGALDAKYVVDADADLSGLSPTTWCLCDEAELEGVLRERAERLGVRLRPEAELVSFEQEGWGEQGVLAAVRDRAGGEEHRVRACALVDAGGTGGAVREALGIGFDARTLGSFVTVRFTADLSGPLRGRRFIMGYVDNPGVRGSLMPLDNRADWLLHVRHDPEREPAGWFTEERCAELVRAATGVADLEPRIESVSAWAGRAGVAERFGDGPVHLVGDAAHVMPPSGGFDAGTGVIDAHNLAWKLVAVLDGWAHPDLLDTYDEERRPVCAATAEQAVLRAGDRARLLAAYPDPADPELVQDPLVWLSSRYRSSAVTPWDEGTLPGYGLWAAENDGRPGSRAPHLRLRRGGAEISVHDLFGRSMVLLTGPDNRPWREAARSVAAELGTPVQVYGIGSDLEDLDDRWPELYGVTAQGAVLVRPDGVVAWRCTEAPIFTRTVLRGITKRVLRLDRRPAEKRTR
ncbi:FAD-dependent monooxygenase [Streptomyces naganishii]|uniref:FAD-binding monooxygenase n=1 Tax=Streptomyces naganishii JCM 4654 TaxID=1306179 RepID=A0A919CXC4_9ACTN|nr:FAD-dependent monooxygenase [Streptomyces naganishii]GHD93812.1 FAD-binding monooxygenase [Streptomyces naganishii JCM 4654]